MWRLRFAVQLPWGTAPAVSQGRIFRLLRFLPLLLLVPATASAWVNAGEVNQAALVVVHGDGRVLTRCVAFEEPQISGLDLLQRSGLDINLEASSDGAAICRLDGEGCTFPGQNCFCQCEGATCVYWSYWQWSEGGWRYSQKGAASSTVLPGGVDGWVWGAGTVERASSPPAIAFADICAPPTPTLTVTPSSTATPIPTPMPAPTATPSSTALPAPADTRATDTPTASATSTATPTFMPPAPLAAIATATSLPTFTPSPTLTAIPQPSLSPAATPAPPPVIEHFTADRREIVVGETAMLSWRVTNAEAVELHASGRAVAVPNEGSLLLAPPQNTTYQLVAANGGGSTATSMTIVVRPRAAAPDEPQPTQPELQPTDPQTSLAATAISTHAQAVSQAEPILIVPSPLPTDTPFPTLAPVVLARDTLVAETTNLSPAAGEATFVSEATLPLVVVGLVALVGIPLLMAAALLVLWLSRRPS